MLQQLINRNMDIERLATEGYSVNFIDGHLVLEHIPYVNQDKQIKWGALVAPLNLKDDYTLDPPTDHVINFMGEFPCDNEGNRINGILLGENIDLSSNLKTNYSFSNKPPEGFTNYYDKFIHYTKIISQYAQEIDAKCKPNLGKPFKLFEKSSAINNLKYYDTNSLRARIYKLNERFNEMRIGIVGLGGSGSYILDFIAKTNVSEIHLYDDDIFCSHNSFRAPGAPEVELLHSQTLKIDYLESVYSRMHQGIKKHPTKINSVNIHELKNLDFVFLSIDTIPVRQNIIEYLKTNQIPFIDVGIGINQQGEQLSVMARVSLNQGNDPNNTIENPEHDLNEIYKSNIQIAEINALNACLAVIKWKQFYGFYTNSQGNYVTNSFCGEPFKIMNDE
ncbi:ThiF family adenylyltransferase [Faecalibacter bovis]|uniref:ThiF family adenylyltransferase n=1 Tax=Faecalibacter bovis TaxID=2898187 RepID=A0ABX7XFV7_9FLAO|nr:ThiF family adenylyltransferase [Faecalibacter bovis]QTV06743.1 ThiF family adenylyltransferase [Faecalibacter bovis]